MSDYIEVNNQSWHARVYLWWYFAKWPHKKAYGHKIVGNLCPYVRTVLLWAPCRWLFNQGKVGKVSIAYIAWPILLLSIPQPIGYLSYKVKYALWIVYGVLACIAMFIGLCFTIGLVFSWADGIWHWSDRFDEVQRRHRQIKMERYLKMQEWKEPKKGPSFWKLIGQKISAAHDRVCPELVFKSPDKMLPPASHDVE